MTPHISEFATLGCEFSATHSSLQLSGQSTQAVRTLPTIRMMQTMFSSDEWKHVRPSYGRYVSYFQYFDIALNDALSLAFCKRIDSSGAVLLVPDTYYFNSGGYHSIRQVVLAGELPPWPMRKEQAFWRGTPTIEFDDDNKKLISAPADVARVKLCLALANNDLADAAIAGTWGRAFSPEVARAFYSEHGIFGEFIPVLEHASYRYLIDIDGVASAWSLFEKLLLGSTVIKIGSPYEQWFYKELVPWEHYVPASSNFSDIAEILSWCQQNPRRAQEIAGEGQRIAVEWCFERARRFIARSVVDAAFWL